MKKTLFASVLLLALSVLKIFAQTTPVTVNASDIINSNSKLIILTGTGQSFFTGHQAGGSYAFPDGIFRAITDNSNGIQNYYFDGVTGTTRNFSVRADGQGYFAGNVGIGTTSPATTLDLQKQYNSSVGLEEAPAINFTTNNGSSYWSLGQVSSYVDAGVGNSNSGYPGGLLFKTKSADGSQSTLPTIKMAINAGGNVGIGTTNPSALLTLGTNVTSNPNPNTTGADIPYSSLDFQNNYGGTYFNVGKIASIQENGAFLDAGALSFSTGAGSLAERMRITTNGNIGIGTKTPDEKLSVYGTIHSQEVKVDLSVPGPDYVFDKNYNLKSLAEIQWYIIQNKHLPEVPSAAEMAKDGLKLGDMNMLLLKKVEELTLYMIDKDNQLKYQQKKIYEQEEKQSELEKRISALEKKPANHKKRN